MSVKIIAIALGATLIAGPALADCKDDLSDLNKKIVQFKSQSTFGTDIRKLRASAALLGRYDNDDACEEMVEEIKEIIEEREEILEERREAAREIERYTKAVPVATLRGVVRARTVQHLDVVDATGEELGVVEDVAIDSSTGGIAFLVISHGGFLGIGEKHLAVPWSSFKITKDREELVLPVTEDHLEKAPSFDWDNRPDMDDKAWRARIEGYYREAK